MSASNTYTTPNPILKDFLSLIGKFVHGNLVTQIEYLKVENEILRSKLPKRIATSSKEKRRLIKFGLPLGGKIKNIISIVSYSTFRRWILGNVCNKAESPKGRRRTAQEICNLIVRLAKENHWGYTRILGELKKLCIKKVSRNTVKNILIANGLDPAPQRGEDTWNDFINRHIETLWACDFFTKTVWTILGPKTFYVFFFINVHTRKVCVAGMTENPTREWVTEQAKAVSHFFDTDKTTDKFLIRDGDKKFSKEFDDALKEYKVKVQRIPFRSPNMNPYAEGWVGTIKRECLNHFLVLGTDHLKYIITEFVNYYNTVRPHTGKNNNPLDHKENLKSGEIICETKLGGMIKHYYRE